MAKRDLAFSVVVPAHRAEATIHSCLTALVGAGFAAENITVVDDGSPDRTGEIANNFGVHVVSNLAPTRPARARNKGAAAVSGDVLVFVDADVLVHQGLKARLIDHFQDDTLTAVVGSYDNAPTAPSVVSRYRNILHHVTHQAASGEVDTFWSGLGAVRRVAFEMAGGFDPTWEDIEDVELGLRLSSAGGRTILDAGMYGTHLKDWTLKSMFRTDLFGRAVPWTRLLRTGRLRFGTLNTSLGNSLSAGAVAVALVSALAMPLSLNAGWILMAATLVFVASNLPLWSHLARAGGWRFAVAAMPYHVVHYVAGLLGYAKVRLFEKRTPS